MNFSPLLIQWNCRSLRSNGHWLKTSPALNARILCLQETFLSPKDAFTLPQKILYRADRIGSRGGGLLTAVSSSLPSYGLQLPTCTDPAFEALGVAVFLDSKWHTIVNIYSPNGAFQETWLNEVVTTFDPPLIILGDFNINILPRSPPQSPRTLQLMDWISTQDLCLLNLDNPTRTGSSGQASLLDLTLLSPELYNVLHYYVHPDQFDSDHHPILLLSAFLNASPTPLRRPRWKKAADTINSSPFSLDTTYNSFISTCSRAISDTASRFIPTARRYCPWWDSTCKDLLVLKRKHLRLARSRCSRSDWLTYKKIAGKLRRYIKFATRRFWDTVCTNSCNSGHIYKLLKRLTARDTLQVDNIIKNPNPQPIISAQAYAFLHYFSQGDCDKPLPYDLSSENPEMDVDFTLAELKTALQHTRPTTPGTDGISVRLLQNLSDCHLQTLLSIYNTIFASGDLPPSWKLSTIVPIRKPGKPSHSVSSYRPIALTSVACKVFERMLLRRLLAWGGQRNLFHSDHFGFLPTRDCTIALCTFLQDILKARSNNYFVAAVCLDIKSAYDSVCPEILTYKLATLGIGGKTGRWLAAFTHNRLIQIRWKSFMTHAAPCSHGVPQGSVLSPLLFLLYTLDITETLESGVSMILYADDILLYVTDQDEVRARRKMQDSLTRVQVWCSAHELTISPSKCTAINFTRRRDPGAPPTISGFELPWNSPVRILGIWFSRNLCFTPHFHTVKLKAQRSLNYLKAITTRSRGATSHHLLVLIHSLIRSKLEFGAPLFFDSPPTALRILETSYNAAIRLATGLPSWTPLPVLRREAGVSSITSRLHFLTKIFLIRLLASPPGLRLAETVRSVLTAPDSHWKWWTPLQHLSDIVGGPLTQILRYYWPPPPGRLHLKIISCGLPFQNTSLPDSAIAQAWHSWLSTMPRCSIFATDASKDASKTSIAAIDTLTSTSIAGLIPHTNSVFTAEALALQLALTSLPMTSSDIVVLSDSLSVLKALDAWSFKSSTVILLLLRTIQQLSDRGHVIQLVWCPGHKGILPNERADALAKNGPFSCTLSWISPEDSRKHVQTDWRDEILFTWINCDYANSFSHLLPDRQFSKWVTSRPVDVALARWRSRTLLTCQRLYRMNLTFSPLCSFCHELETPDHILLACPRLTGPRTSLFNALSLQSSASYSDVLRAAFASSHDLSLFIRFSKFALS